MRSAEWGHWGLTFWQHEPGQPRFAGKIMGEVAFAVGPRGPIDAGEVRERYAAMCKAWEEKGELP